MVGAHGRWGIFRLEIEVLKCRNIGEQWRAFGSVFLALGLGPVFSHLWFNRVQHALVLHPVQVCLIDRFNNWFKIGSKPFVYAANLCKPDNLSDLGIFRASFLHFFLRLKCVGYCWIAGGPMDILDSQPWISGVSTGQFLCESHGYLVTSKGQRKNPYTSADAVFGRKEWKMMIDDVSIFQYLSNSFNIFQSFRITLWPFGPLRGQLELLFLLARPTMLASKTPGSLSWRAWLQESPRRHRANKLRLVDSKNDKNGLVNGG